MGRDSTVSEKVKLIIAVLSLQLCLAGFHVVSRAALNMGISKIVFPVYRNMIALVLLAPFAYFLEKTVVSIGGATVITLYKGLPVLLHTEPHGKLGALFVASSNPILNWTLGCVYILGNCVAWSGWMVLQVPVLKKYPARLSVLTLTCTFGLAQFLIIAAFVENDIERWKEYVYKFNSLNVCYSLQGLVACGLSLSLQIWCIDRGGPLFTAVFQPVQTVLVAIMAAMILGDQLYTGG
uniref:WAT1-related protein n=1 Tax=Ananas comosus var. bracteatus TaxID=296719 RepID=A0A6V7NW09_ANACO|nr:unnamed protein product [Ananas comosus var. bracteatus]